MTAAAWAQKAAEATASNSSIGDGEFMDMFEPQRRLYRRQAFIRNVLRQAMQVGHCSQSRTFHHTLILTSDLQILNIIPSCSFLLLELNIIMLVC